MSTFLYSYKLKFWTKKSIVMNYDKLFIRFLEFDITLRWFNLPADKYWQSLEWHVLWHSYWLARDIWCVTHLQANIFLTIPNFSFQLLRCGSELCQYWVERNFQNVGEIQDWSSIQAQHLDTSWPETRQKEKSISKPVIGQLSPIKHSHWRKLSFRSLLA